MADINDRWSWKIRDYHKAKAV